jgi:hypothetical protein
MIFHYDQVHQPCQQSFPRFNFVLFTRVLSANVKVEPRFKRSPLRYTPVLLSYIT